LEAAASCFTTGDEVHLRNGSLDTDP
jgi:hypothetical protein